LCEKCHDVKYAYIGLDVKNGMDLSAYGWGEVNYEIGSSLENYNSSFHSSVINCKDSYYCFTCQNSDHLFGCVGLRKQSYCILNKKYTKEEYEEIVPRIIEQMTKNGEWGEFLPVRICPWSYNETVASEYYSLLKEEVIERGWKWKEDDPKEYEEQTYKIPDNIKDVGDDIIESNPD